jgi:hypothetical protein
MAWSSLRSIAVCLLGLGLSASCAIEHETDPYDPCGDAAADAADDASSDASGRHDASEDDAALSSEDSGAEGDGEAPEDSGRDCSVRDPVVGVSFQPLTVRTEDGQTVALMELTGLTFLPGGRGALVWEKSGRLTHYRVEGDELVLLGEVRFDNVLNASDCGFVNVALDPEWETNHYIFVAHCISPSFSAVVRYQFDGSDYESVAETASPVIEVGDPDAPKAWHNIGALGFFDDAEHSMWLLAGEKNMSEQAQDLTTDLGKVLRIIPRRDDSLSGYEPHPDNPFAGDPELSSGANIYAWGLRSPWRGTIDRDNRVIIGDVGGMVEEVNIARGPEHNFGWSVHNGPCKENCSGITDPVVSWGIKSDMTYRVEDKLAKASTSRVSWVGAYYAGDENDRYDDFLDDTVLFSDMCLGFVRALQIDDAGRAARDEHAGHLVGLSGAAVGPDGYLYATSFGGCLAGGRGIGGGVYRVVPRMAEDEPVIPPRDPDKTLLEDPLGPFPLKLSDTGIFIDAAMTTPSPRAIAYEPTLALWSNGSDKERFIVLPEGTKIDNSRRAAWDFPPGTLFFKTFAFDTVDEAGLRIETRVIRRTESGYDYHGYRWQADERDADLLSLELSVGVKVSLSEEEEIVHAVPSSFDCRTCHESNGTVVIGFDELRLNGPRSGETTAQLDVLAEAGLFTTALPQDRDVVSHEDALTREVLGYLHGNCAHCHNGSPQAMSPLSLEHPVALANIVGVPTEGSGQIDGIRVVPGDAAGSVLFQAFSLESDDPELKAMPPVGVQRVDAETVELLRDWIDTL